MTLLSEWIDDADGVLHKRHLVARGARDRDLTRAVRSGDVRRARRGWYTTFQPDDPRFVAVAVGGRLTGVSALHFLGAWMWDSRPVPVVSVPPNAARLRRRRRVRVVYDSEHVSRRGGFWAVDRRDALARAIVDSTFEGAVTLWDWARASDHFSESDLNEVTALLPADARAVALWSDPGADSILESVARVRLVQAGYSVETQCPVGRTQAIDLVIDGAVALELDGREFHADTFESDRNKDLSITLEGRSPLRATYDMVRRRWDRIVSAIDQALSQHRDGSRRRWRRSGGGPRPRRGRGRRSWRLAPAPARA